MKTRHREKEKRDENEFYNPIEKRIVKNAALKRPTPLVCYAERNYLCKEKIQFVLLSFNVF